MWIDEGEDTSALFSLLEDEDGADRVEALLRAEKVYLPLWISRPIPYK